MVVHDDAHNVTGFMQPQPATLKFPHLRGLRDTDMK